VTSGFPFSAGNDGSHVAILLTWGFFNNRERGNPDNKETEKRQYKGTKMKTKSAAMNCRTPYKLRNSETDKKTIV